MKGNEGSSDAPTEAATTEGAVAAMQRELVRRERRKIWLIGALVVVGLLSIFGLVVLAPFAIQAWMMRHF